MNKNEMLLKACDSEKEDLVAVKRLTRWCFGLEANVNTKKRDGNTPLSLAIRRNHTEVCKYLISKGATISEGKPLLSAAYERNFEIVGLLLEKGVDVNTTDSNGTTALMECIRSKSTSKQHLAIVNSLLAKGANVNLLNKKGQSALLLAYVESHQPEIATKLVEAGANINIGDDSKRTPLWRASISNDVEMCRLLLDKGANIDVLDCNGNSPLMEAVRFGATSTVPYLIEKGATTNIINRQGKSILSIAVESGVKKNIEYFTKWFSNKNGLLPVLNNQTFKDKGHGENYLTLLKSISIQNAYVEEEITGSCSLCDGKGSYLKEGFYATNSSSDFYGSCDDNYESCSRCGGSGKGKQYRIKIDS